MKDLFLNIHRAFIIFFPFPYITYPPSPFPVATTSLFSVFMSHGALITMAPAWKQPKFHQQGIR